MSTDEPELLNNNEIFATTNQATFIPGYPAIHSSPLVTKEIVANYSLLLTIQGSNPKLRPYMLTSHLDVVPAVRSKWSSEPFEAVIKEDGYIYARGTMDAKHLTIAMLEATEHLLKNNFKPQRTYYLAFGHDGKSSSDYSSTCNNLDTCC